LCRLIHLGHCSLPSDLEEYEIMIRAIAANIPVALYPVIRATGVRGPPPDLYRGCLKPACIEGTPPTGKGVSAVTSTSRPAFDRSNARHDSKSSRGAPPTSSL
jgi:hypothetical protein